MTEHNKTHDFLNTLRNSSPDFWIERGNKNTLSLFRLAAERVPAYKDFLKKEKINPKKIRTVNDFKNVPTTDKENYLTKYPVNALCLDGKFSENRFTLFTTSGSTGKPFYFPYTRHQYLEYALLAEIYLLENFDIASAKTLYVNAFPMGAWIGGVFTYDVIKTVAERGNYHLSIISPGIDKKGVIDVIKKFGHLYDQVIIGSYGPFLKDILDDGEIEGVQWKKYNLKFIFSAEGFSEEFRKYVTTKVGIKNYYKDTLNHYGTVDLGTMAHETPISILIRCLAVGNRELYSKIFGKTNQLPTLTQFIPEMFYFEEKENSLLCSSYGAFPLLRYDLKDRGMIIGWEEMLSLLKSEDVDIEEEGNNNNVSDTYWKLPFVYVHERSDFAVSFYAFMIYPQTIRKALLRRDLENEVTGKFSMAVRYDKEVNQVLEINVELKNNKKETMEIERKVGSVVLSQLLEESSEYRETYKEKGDLIKPKIVLKKYEDPKFFKPGIKQRWTLKE